MSKGDPVPVMPHDAPRVGEVWRHYKGGEYTIIGVALHSDEMWVVVYEPLYESEIKLFTRPLAQWREVVEWQDSKVERFSKMQP